MAKSCLSLSCLLFDVGFFLFTWCVAIAQLVLVSYRGNFSMCSCRIGVCGKRWVQDPPTLLSWTKSQTNLFWDHTSTHSICLLASISSDEKSVLIEVVVLLYVICHILLWPLSRLFFNASVSAIWLWCAWAWFSSYLFCLRSADLESLNLYPSPDLGQYQSFLQIFFCPFSVSSFWRLSYRSLSLCSLFSSSFFSLSSDWVISFTESFLCHPHCAVNSIQWIFYFRYCVLFNSRIYYFFLNMRSPNFHSLQICFPSCHRVLL